MKQRVPSLKLVRETIRELSGEELSKAAGGSPIQPSELPTCLCSSIPCGGLPVSIAISGTTCA
jgi:hypothetical protein